jgi:hypothetical protein
LDAARRALQNILKYHDYPGMDGLVEKLRADANCPNLNIVRNEIYGSGGQLMLLKPGLLDIGVNNDSDQDFVQARNPYADPNDVQFWIQAAYDTRIQDVHEKVFQMNELANTGLDLAGDYQDAPAEPEAEA